MKLDRRMFTQSLALGAGGAMLGLPERGSAAAAAPSYRATLVLDARTGRILHRSGACATRFSPCSTFKIPLALMGFDTGILHDAHSPAWDYRPEVHPAFRATDRQRTDPTSFEANSVIWFSREITARLGMRRFQAYVDRFGYGNRDLSGDPGKNNGLTHAWLASSLAISPDEQVAFLRRLLAHRLASSHAHRMTEAVLPVFPGAGGWTVHGKTGSGSLRNARGVVDENLPLGWFVGWAEKGGRRLIFARLGAGEGMRRDVAGGPAMREAMLADIARLARA
jgi:beta-lactamase class D